MTVFKKVKIEDVLKWQPQIEIDPLKITELTIEGEHSYPFYGQATINNGIISYLTLSPNVLNNKTGKPTILIHSNNQNIVYLETPFYLKDGHGATSVLQADFLNEKIALYIMTCIKKVISVKFAYNDKATKIALKNTFIELPFTEKDELDCEYMEKYIKALEKERIAILKQFLTSAGLDNCDVTQNEIEFLKTPPELKEFKVSQLFDIHPTKCYKGKNADLLHPDGCNPVLSNVSTNNGIGGYSKLSCTEKGGIITFSDTTTSNAIFYQPNDFIGYSHVQGMYPYSEKWTEKSLLYFMTLFKKIAKTIDFDYATKFNRKIALDFTVKLPTKSNGDIDYEYMEKYITIMEKRLIQNVEMIK